MLRLMSAALLAVLASVSALSAQSLTLSDGAGWRTGIFAGLYSPLRSWGTSTIDGTSADVDLNLRDALEVLDLTITGRLEAWNGDFGLIAEGHYLAISEKSTLTFGSLPGRTVKVEAQQSWISLMGGYRVARGTLGNGMPFAVDLQGGARHNRIKQTVVGSGGILNLGGTETWWEPVVGARFAWEINDRWSGSALVDASGFGTNGNDLAFSASLALSKKINDRTSLVFGWQYYEIDFSTQRAGGTFAYDMRQTGPFIGVSHVFN